MYLLTNYDIRDKKENVFIMNARRTPLQAPSANVTATRVKADKCLEKRDTVFSKRCTHVGATAHSAVSLAQAATHFV